MGCRGRTDQTALLRVVASQDDTTDRWVVLPDPRRLRPGRGAYLHLDPQCLQSALARRAFARALRLPAGSQPDADAVQSWLQEQCT